MNFPLLTHLPEASRLIFGCMGLGGTWDQQALTETNISHAQAAIEAALDIGITVFDHADIYTLGKAEQSFGEVLRRRPSLRDRMLLQSKCGIRFADGDGPKRYDLSAQHIRHSVDAILRRLGCDHLDVLLWHRPDPLLDPAEIAEAWAAIHREGKARYWGVSNMHAGHMRLLQQHLGEAPLVNQLDMSLLKLDWLEAGSCFNDRQGANSLVWADTLEHCRLQGVQIQAWAALARGWLSGALPHDAPERVRQLAQRVQQLAEQYQISREGIVLAWLLRHPAGIQPVIGSSHPGRIRACADALKLELSRGDWYELYQLARGGELP